METEQHDWQLTRVIRGVITKVYDKGIIIKPDEEKEGIISEGYDDRDYPKEFTEGQRVVHASFQCERPVTEEEREEDCPRRGNHHFGSDHPHPQNRCARLINQPHKRSVPPPRNRPKMPHSNKY